MRFWDASAIIPLIVPEPTAPSLISIPQRHEGMTVWWGSAVECVSAFWRRHRDGKIPAPLVTAALENLNMLLDSCETVMPVEAIRDRAKRLLASHPLGAADALQLAAALAWTRERPEGADFVCLDRRLREAASREGFAVIPAGV